MKLTLLAAALLFTGLSVSAHAADMSKHKTMVHPMKHAAGTPMVHPAIEASTDKLNQQQLDQMKK